MKAAVDAGLEQFGRIDVLVNAAGVVGFGSAHTLEVAEFERVVDINLKGSFLVAKHVLPGMIERRSGQHRPHRERRGSGGHQRSARVQRLEGRRGADDEEHGARLLASGHPRELHLPRWRRDADDRDAPDGGAQGARREAAQAPPARPLRAAPRRSLRQRSSWRRTTLPSSRAAPWSSMAATRPDTGSYSTEPRTISARPRRAARGSGLAPSPPPPGSAGLRCGRHRRW